MHGLLISLIVVGVWVCGHVGVVVCLGVFICVCVCVCVSMYSLLNVTGMPVLVVDHFVLNN